MIIPRLSTREFLPLSLSLSLSPRGLKGCPLPACARFTFFSYVGGAARWSRVIWTPPGMSRGKRRISGNLEDRKSFERRNNSVRIFLQTRHRGEMETRRSRVSSRQRIRRRNVAYRGLFDLRKSCVRICRVDRVNGAWKRKEARTQLSETRKVESVVFTVLQKWN